MQEHIKKGDRVTFDTDKLDAFKAETNIQSVEIQQYRELVLAGADQIGVAQDFNGELVTVAYPDGWVIPIPAKYLLLLPNIIS